MISGKIQFRVSVPQLVILALSIINKIHECTARTAEKNVTSAKSQLSGRKLQLGTGILDRYQVGESTINFQGTEIKFVYPLSDLVPDNSVVITTYSDIDCSLDITDNNYLVPLISYDDNPNPTGEKNREVTVTYTIDPNEIRDEDVWIDNSDGTVYLSFCTAINLYTGPINDPGSGPYSKLDTVVNLQVDFEGGWDVELPVGPSDIRKENAHEIYLVEGFICDESNSLLDSEEPMKQGQKVRVCVKPTDEALADGIYMRRVDSFTFYRFREDGTQITQLALRDGKSANNELTELKCLQGSELCWFETLLKADFYYKAGMIMGYGEAWLQFGSGSSRRLEPNIRSLIDVSGGFANTASIELSFFAVPDGNKYLAEAYHCDQHNHRLEQPPALVVGQSVRVCVAPTEEGREVGIRIASIDSFNFTRAAEKQNAVIDNAGTADGQSVVVCKPNSIVCAFRTIFQNSFFTSDGLVSSDGLVTLQYSQNDAYSASSLKDQDGSPPTASRRVEAVLPLFYAGQSAVSVETLVIYQRDDELNPCAFDHKFTEWWAEEAIKDRYKYIAIIATAGGILASLLFCCWCVPPWFFRQRRRQIDANGNDIRVNVEVKKENETTNVVESSPHKVVPGANDVVLGELNHPMTSKFLKHVQSVAREYPSQGFGPSIYKMCKKPFEYCEFFSMDVDGSYKKLTGEETVPFIGKVFLEAKLQIVEDGRALSCSDFTATTVSSSLSSSGTRQLRRINSTGSLDVFPTPNDIVLGDQSHPGTQRFLRHVRRIAREHDGKDFNPSIYRSIKKGFNGSDIFMMKRDKSCKRPKKTEICALVAEAYEESKMPNGRSGSVCSTIEMKKEFQDELSSMGVSLCRSWGENGQNNGKSRGTKRSVQDEPALSLCSIDSSSRDLSQKIRQPTLLRKSRSLTALDDISASDADVICSRSTRQRKGSNRSVCSSIQDGGHKITRSRSSISLYEHMPSQSSSRSRSKSRSKSRSRRSLN